MGGGGWLQKRGRARRYRGRADRYRGRTRNFGNSNDWGRRSSVESRRRWGRLRKISGRNRGYGSGVSRGGKWLGGGKWSGVEREKCLLAVHLGRLGRWSAAFHCVSYESRREWSLAVRRDVRA